MKQLGGSRSHWARSGAVIGIWTVGTLCGCGSQGGESLFLSASYPVRCDDPQRAGQPATDRVVIEWSGGTSDLSEEMFMVGLDFASFELTDGGTLAEVSDEFMAAVRDQVTEILCSFPAAAVYVENGEATGTSGFTEVLVTQQQSPNAPGQIGKGDYDPCNLTHSNEAIIYGGELLDLGPSHPFEDWVTIFANVIAHEIGHTLGYAHVDRTTTEHGDRRLQVELMLAVHTAQEMIRPQRYLANDSNCPVAEDSSSAKRIFAPDDTCMATK